MRLRFRGWLVGMVASVAAVAFAAVMLAVPAAEAAVPFGVEKFVAANCYEPAKVGEPQCGEEPGTAFPIEPTLPEAEKIGYTQAAGHPPLGVTSFKVKTEGTKFPELAPAEIATTGPVTHVRTDVGQGVSTNPEAVAKCSFEEFGKEALPSSGLFEASKCKSESEIGENKVVVWLGPLGGDLPLQGKVYNLVQPTGLASDFGVVLPLPIPLTEAKLKAIFHGSNPTVEKAQYYAHTLIEGGVEWAGNYHDYYEITVAPEPALISSRLVLKGNILLAGKENGGFITNPSNCAGPGPATTSTVTLETEAHSKAERTYTTPIGTEGCKGEKGLQVPPFEPGFKLTPETTQSDAPDGITTEATLQHNPSPTAIDNSQLKTASFTLPEGMTLNPSAASGLEACSAAQIGIKSRNAVTCPEKSRLGSATLTVPDLPSSEPLEGSVYLGGGPTITEPATKPSYTIYVDAESARYGVSVRLEGTVTPDEKTGQVTTTFKENPEQPFSNLKLAFKGGALAPIANPLTCGPATTNVSFSPYTENPLSLSPAVTPFTVDSNGGACASPLPFAPGQSTSSVPTSGGAATNFTLNVSTGRRPAVPVEDQRRPASRLGRQDPGGAALPGAAGHPGHVSRRQSDRIGQHDGRLWADAVSLQRAGLLDRPHQRRALRDDDRGRGDSRPIQPGYGRGADGDLRRSAHDADHGRR